MALLVACGGPGASPTDTPAGTATTPVTPSPASTDGTDESPAEVEPTAVTAIVISNVNYTPLFVGQETGIFLKHGIDLTVELAPTAADVARAMQAGEADVSSTSWVGVVPAVAQGVELKVFGLVVSRPDVVNHDGQLALVVGPHVDVEEVADLRGMTVAVPFGGGVEQYVRGVLSDAGLDPDSDVTLQNLPMPNELAALEAQSADAVGTAEPYGALITTSLDGSRVLVQGGGYAESRLVMVGRESWLEDDPAVVDRFVEALLESQQFVRQNPEEAAEVASHYLTGIDEAVILSALQILDFDPRWSPNVLEAFEGASQDLLDAGTVTELPEATDVLVMDLLTESEDKYPEYFSDLD